MQALIPAVAPAFPSQAGVAARGRAPRLSFLKFSPIFVLPAEIFACRICLLAVCGYPGIYKHRFFALWLNASTAGAGRIRQLTGCSSLNQKTNESPDPIAQTETLGHCETPGQDRRPPPGSPSRRGCPAEGGCCFPSILFPGYRRWFEGAKATYIPKGESRVAFLWLVACRVLPAAAYRAEPSLNPASPGRGCGAAGAGVWRHG